MQGIAFSPDSKMLASLAGDGRNMAYEVRTWNLQTGEVLHTFDIGWGWDIAYSPDGKTLATPRDYCVTVATPSPGAPGGCRQETGILLVDVFSGQTLRVFTTAAPGRLEFGSEMSVAFSPDGKTIASVNTNYGARLWDVATGQLIRTFKPDAGGRPGRVGFSPDGRILALVWYSTKAGTVVLFDLISGQVLRSFGEPGNEFASFAFSPAGKTLALGGKDAKLFDLSTGQYLGTFAGDAQGVVDMSFSPDGKTLASAGDTVKLGDLGTGRLINTLTGHFKVAQRVSFSPDGKILASVDTGRIFLWDMTTLR